MNTTLSDSIKSQLQALNIDLKGKSNGHLRTKCPQCSQSRTKKYLSELSVDITEEGILFCCHHCSWSGKVGSTVSIKPVFQKPTYNLDTPLDEKVISYFKGRGINEEVLKRNKIGYSKTWMPSEDKEIGTITFPYLRNGEVVNVQYRSGNKDFKMVSGAEICLYGLDDIQGDVLYWVEGQIDKLSLEVAGFTSCVSVPNGAPAPNAKNFDKHFSYLENTDFSNINKHIIAVDTDAPGRALKAELIRRLGPEKCFFVDFPEKDANDVLVKHGIDVLKEYLENPKPVPISGVVEAIDLKDAVYDLYDNGYPPGENPGTPGLGKYYTIKPGQLSIITGAPSAGKSAIVDFITYSLAEQSGWNFAVCSPENHPIQDHIIKLVELKAKVPFITIPRDLVGEYVDWVDDHYTFISPEEDQEWSIANIIRIAKSVVHRKGCRGLIIDPANETVGYRDPGLSETEYVSRFLSELRRFARSYQVHVFLVAHPTKLYKNEDGQFPVPNLYQISGSAHYYNKADAGISVWRDMKDPGSPVTVDIQKIRFKRDGQVGTHLMSYDTYNNHYSDFQDF